MAPIRVGITGLSATSSWAVTAHLANLKDSSKYQITGVCNSSLASSEAAIKAHGLPDTAKAYGSVADMAASSDVDLVVCSVRVDRHYDALKPAIAAGKDCFVEWPLGANSTEAKELQQLAEEKGIKTMVGLQGHRGPPTQRIKQLVDEGAIGRIISSNMQLAVGLATDKTSESISYLNDAKTGGNMVTIPLGHMYDSVSYVLGELQHVSATLTTQHPEIAITGADGSTLRTMKRDIADHATFSGVLANGAHSTANMTGSPAFKGEPGFIWQIEGDKGIIDVRADAPFALSMSLDIKIRLQLFGSNEVQDIPFTEDRPGPSGNIGRLYDAFAEGKGYPDWKYALRRHAWADALHESSKTGKSVAYV